jgi:hypothetical protein
VLRWRNRPAVGAGILVEPAYHLGEALPEPFRRDANASTDGITPLRRRDYVAGIARTLCSLFVHGKPAHRLVMSSPFGLPPDEAIFAPCVAVSASRPMSARPSSSTRSRRIGPGPIPAEWNAAPTDLLPAVRYDRRAGERSLDRLRLGSDHDDRSCKT